MAIGEKLKFLRNEKDYTLKQLAVLTGISISFISDIENGRRIPGLDNLKKLAAGLSVSASELIAEAGVGVPTISGSNKLDNTEDELDEIISFMGNLTFKELENIHNRPELIELIKETNSSSREEILKTIRILKALKDK